MKTIGLPVTLTFSTECAYWNNDFVWTLVRRIEPTYIFLSRAFLIFSIIIGSFGTFLAIVGTGMVCCKTSCIPVVQEFG